MKNNTKLFILSALLVSSTSCNTSTPVIEDEAAYIESIELWQDERLEGLKEKDGWLNLAGIYWLEEGIQTIGSDSSNDIIFPAKAPAYLGTLNVENEKVYLEVSDNVELHYKNELANELDLTYEASGDPSYITHGDFAWYIMRRHTSLAIRLRDYKNPAIAALDHIPSYPIDPDYVVEAELLPFEENLIITVNTPFEGYTQDYDCPGELHFKIKGKGLKLFPFSSGDGYFLIIADETSGIETYGAGRFMYVNPDSTGRIILDFNKAYNPPCALTAFAACPMPPKENYLPAKIEAGEKMLGIH
jgi:uncharacterized protein